MGDTQSHQNAAERAVNGYDDKFDLLKEREYINEIATVKIGWRYMENVLGHISVKHILTHKVSAVFVPDQGGVLEDKNQTSAG